MLNISSDLRISLMYFDSVLSGLWWHREQVRYAGTNLARHSMAGVTAQVNDSKMDTNESSVFGKLW